MKVSIMQAICGMMHHHKVKKKSKKHFTQEPLNLGRYAHLDGWAFSGPVCV